MCINYNDVIFVLANFTGATISINLCYNITTLTELQACRTDRRAIALFMGRSSNGTYDEVNCKQKSKCRLRLMYHELKFSARNK